MHKTSIVILTLNQLALTRLCLDSIRRHTPESIELIVVDNGSTDETLAYLSGQPDVKLIANGSNLGFAKGCNLGLEASDGDTVLFLNNDTVVTPHWLSRMLEMLYSAEDIGVVGPVTNYSSGQQRIAIPYTNIAEADAFSAEHAQRFRGYSFDTRRIVGFCMLIKRSVLDETGGFDERYGLGNYEDDDLCLRVMRQGYRLRIVYDAYIHHFGHMTTNLLPDANLGGLLQINREKARLKWGGDIHELMYREQAEFTLVVPLYEGTLHADERLETAIAAIRGAAAELVFVDHGTDQRTLEEAAKLTDLIVVASDSAPSEWWSEVAALASKPYLWWMNADETLNACDLRKLAGLKMSMPEGAEAVSVLLELENAGYRGGDPAVVRRIRMSKRDAGFGWNAFVHDFVPAPGASIYSSDIKLVSRAVDE